MDQESSRDVPARALFGLRILSADFNQAMRLLGAAALETGGPARIVVTPNVDHVVRLERDAPFKARYASADFIFADGMPIVWASRLLGRPLAQRVTGADLFVALCRQAAQARWPVSLVGGQPGAEAQLQTLFQSVYPGLDIDICCPSMGFDPLGAEGDRVAARIRARAPRLVFVCLGLPKQEQWALRHAAAFPGGVLLCVGAAMEFALGLRARAPRWVQGLGAEWLWRLLSDPSHLWRRYLLDDPYFLILCWREWRRARTTYKDDA
ncbi:WecB/TagA/CpsF family glycosyltransferase [Castellaniella caeni]|uniref:WecB/TagA/CpsF family glycosyltransferase n=1 Tax=Castellaniella caeni TaxID=266123 RepID=UPI00082977E4|nr:WecB/TagA/CpsF family glycosyltransferase [Castellaniella caeni]